MGPGTNAPSAISVRAVNPDSPTSIGSDDGLQNGHELDVYRGAKYLGRVRIVETRPDRAVASVLKEFKEVAQDFIRKGDRVATKLRA